MRPARPLALQSYPFLWEDRYLELAAYLTTSPSLFSLTSLGSVPVSNGHPCRGHCPLSHTHHSPQLLLWASPGQKPHPVCQSPPPRPTEPSGSTSLRHTWGFFVSQQ